VYLFDLEAPTPWMPVATCNHPSPSSEDQFGCSVAVSGSRVIVGAAQADPGANDAGSVYVYDLAGAQPTEPRFALSPPTALGRAGFGWSVAIKGTNAVVGAPGMPYLPGPREQAFVYNLAGADPSAPVVELNNPGLRYNQFGTAVAVNETYVAVGAPGGDFFHPSGTVFVYLLESEPQVPELVLFNPEIFFQEGFGYSLGLSGFRLVVGSPGYSPLDFDDVGKAYVFDLAHGIPAVPILMLTNPVPALEGHFGNAVAISDTCVVIGAFEADIGAEDAGCAYVYDLSSGTPSAPTLTLTNPCPGMVHRFGVSVAISGTRVVIGAIKDYRFGIDRGMAYVYDLGGSQPAVPIAELAHPGSPQNAGFGASVGIDGTTVVAGAPYLDANVGDRGGAFVFDVGPALRLQASGPGMATLSWAPAASLGFVLQYTDSLTAPHPQWIDAPTGAENPVTIPITSVRRFYRVARP